MMRSGPLARVTKATAKGWMKDGKTIVLGEDESWVSGEDEAGESAAAAPSPVEAASPAGT